jgi:hypothetical protein
MDSYSSVTLLPTLNQRLQRGLPCLSNKLPSVPVMAFLLLIANANALRTGFPSNLPPQAALPTVRGLYYASSYEQNSMSFSISQGTHCSRQRPTFVSSGWLDANLASREHVCYGQSNHIRQTLELPISGTSSPVVGRGESMYPDVTPAESLREHLSTDRARDL